VAGILDIPYPNQSLDGVLAIGILEYIENQVPEALAEVNRVLKPGGIFFIEVPILNTLRAFAYAPLKKIERALRILQGRQPIFAHYFFSRSELKRLLSEQGFTIIETAPHEIPEADRHFGLYTDWPFLRGKGPRQLNTLGIFLKRIFNSISPWIASQGILIVARKQ
jgi:ubiquinone/menaquinone biosynthesis C-methylase UbiE